MRKKLTVIELNEFNAEFLDSAARELGLKNLQVITAWKKSKTSTEDTLESGFLEPWSQWVSIHTGVTSSQHQIKHLGDIPNLETKQIWQFLGENKISTGIWGVMNGSRHNASENYYFVPDPWSFSEAPYPAELNPFLALVRYAAKNYTSFSILKALRLGAAFIMTYARLISVSRLLEGTYLLAKTVFRFGPKPFVIFCYFEYLSTFAFLKFKKQLNPQFNILFLNSLAHLQHHYWRKGVLKATPEMICGLKYLDSQFGAVLKALDHDEAVIVLNGFSQDNINSEKPWILYRQKHPTQIIGTLGLQSLKTEQLMTYDAHVFFKNLEDCIQAQKELSEATVNGSKAFYVENDPKNALKLFYRVKFSDRVDSSTILLIGGRSYRFLDLFIPVVQPTGRHCQEGTVYSKNIKLPDVIENEKLFKVISSYFDLPEHSSKVHISLNKVIKEQNLILN